MISAMPAAADAAGALPAPSRPGHPPPRAPARWPVPPATARRPPSPSPWPRRSLIAGRAWLLRRRHAALTAGARSIEILAPPVADPAGGAALWANLAGLMRPPLARWRSGQPHLAWEYSWTADSMTVSLWVPGGVPPGMAERAIEAAWPGAHTRTTSPAAAPLPAGCLATGGTLRLARTESPAAQDRP